ncbi:MAG TPA: NADH-ubiquinone oxidoreductase-F iron-sulfur binding region domain-containing protein, partial [Acidimicrobiia bacterium]|nr:NADH-ubiquinone oxidoreductase-F iron-sulfur binding region domain-containing protein [Acidimicrobiia bacterium]
GTGAPPTLVSNAETFANVPGILAFGPEWFRQVGTDASPGTVVCTVSGDVEHAGVAEVAMGTPLGEVIERIGGGARAGRRLVAAMSGVANPLVPASRFDVPVSHEGMDSIGSGLGAAGFIVFDDETDLAAVAAGVSRFLAVESCGQCTPCKQDGLALSAMLDDVRRSDASDRDLDRIADRVTTVADSARCSLASQQQRVITSITDQFPDVAAHAHRERPGAPRYVVAPIVDLADGIAQLDEGEAAKQPDWTFNAVDSGATPAERLASSSPAAVRVAADAVEEPTSREETATPPPRVAHHVSPSMPHNRVDPREVADDPEARLYSSAPIDTDDGVVVIEQQNVGPGNEDGGGEWPDPHTDAEDPAPGAD